MGTRALLTLMYGGKRKLTTPSDLEDVSRGILPQADQLPVHGHTQGVVRVVRGPDAHLLRVVLRPRGLNLALDFTGGVSVEATFSGPADVEKVRAALEAAQFHEPQVQTFGTSREVAISPAGCRTRPAK